MRIIVHAVLSLIGVVGLAGCSVAAEQPEAGATGKGPRIAVLGPEETVFDYSSSACDDKDFPDAPARAIRVGGAVRLYASNDTVRSMTGPDLDHVTQDCAVVLRSAGNPDPAAYDDHSWLATPFAFDDRHVMALIHVEYHGHSHPGRCAFTDYLRCWRNSIALARSDDGGATFARIPARAGLVAMLPYRYDPRAGKTTGPLNPTNIVARDGAYYFIAWQAGYRRQRSGNCVYRSTTPDDATSWRAWDGRDFTVSAADPYGERVDPAQHLCTTIPLAIASGPALGLVFHARTASYVATYMDRDQRGRMVAYFATSKDLTHWTRGGMIFDMGQRKRGCETRDFAYPALIDPSSKDRNFTTVGDTPYLYMTRSHRSWCKRSADRDLVRYRVRLNL